MKWLFTATDFSKDKCLEMKKIPEAFILNVRLEHFCLPAFI